MRDSGITALRLAYIYGHRHVETLLRERGAVGLLQRVAGVGVTGGFVGAHVLSGLGRQVRELDRLAKKDVENPNVVVSQNGVNAREWVAQIVLPATYLPSGDSAERPSPYAGSRFALRVTFPDTYPFRVPKLHFRGGVMWHPHVNFSDGEVNPGYLSDFWVPTTFAEDLFRVLYDLIAHPFTDPLAGQHNASAALQLQGQSAAGLEAFEVDARAAAANEPEA